MSYRALTSLPLFAVVLCAAPALEGQNHPAVGLAVTQVFPDTSPAGPFVGTVCGPFSCDPQAFLALGGFGRLRFNVIGARFEPYLVLGSLAARGCKTFPGVGNALALDEPLFIARLATTYRLLTLVGWVTTRSTFHCLPLPSQVPVSRSS